MFLRDEVSNNSRQSHGRQEDALHPPLEEEVLVPLMVSQVEIDRLVHLININQKHKLNYPINLVVRTNLFRLNYSEFHVSMFIDGKLIRVWRDSTLLQSFYLLEFSGLSNERAREQVYYS